MNISEKIFFLNSGGAYSSASNAVFALFPTLTKDEKDAMGPFIDSQVASGNWALIDDFSHIGLPTQNGLKSWKKGKISVLVGASFVSGLGYSFIASDSIDTGFNLSTDTSQYTLNDSGIDVYCYANSEAATGYNIFVSTDGSSNLVRFTRRSTGGHRMSINSLSNTNGASSDPLGTGLMSLYRPGISNGITYAINNVEIQSLTNVSSAKPNSNLFLSDALFVGSLSSWVVRKYSGFNLSNYLTNLTTLNAALAAL